MKFRAPWGREVVILTAIGLIALGGPIIMMLIGRRPLVPSVIAGIVVVIALWCVRGYELRPQRLLIRRLLWSSSWPLDAGTTVTIRPHAMAGSWRTWGNAGVFAITGHFAGSGLGRYRAFVTDPERTVIVQTATGTVVVSPDRPEDFARAVEQARTAA